MREFWLLLEMNRRWKDTVIFRDLDAESQKVDFYWLAPYGALFNGRLGARKGTSEKLDP